MVVLTSVRVRDGWRRQLGIRHIPKPNRKKFVQRTTMEVTVSAAEVSYLFIGGAAPLFSLSSCFLLTLPSSALSLPLAWLAVSSNLNNLKTNSQVLDRQQDQLKQIIH
eukprot:COSAG01_NODE_370_length_18018_cov_142.063620_23_plen_108_part_00